MQRISPNSRYCTKCENMWSLRERGDQIIIKCVLEDEGYVQEINNKCDNFKEIK